MAISLVSAPVLGFDLVRHPNGRAVADVLLWSLTLGPEDLAEFDAVWATGLARRRSAFDRIRDIEVERGPGVLHGSRLAPTMTGHASGAAESEASSLATLVEGLQRSLIVDLDDLEHLIRHDILAWSLGGAELAVEVLVSAVAAEWIDEIDESIRLDLVAGFDRLRARIASRPADVGPCEPAVAAVLATLENLDEDGRARLRTVNDLLGTGDPSWAASVHEASWAAYTTGRLRAAATAQLLAAQAFTAGGLDAADGAEGLWNLVSGHVHASVVGDVLAADTQRHLSRGWRAALGESR